MARGALVGEKQTIPFFPQCVKKPQGKFKIWGGKTLGTGGEKFFKKILKTLKTPPFWLESSGFFLKFFLEIKTPQKKAVLGGFGPRDFSKITPQKGPKGAPGFF